MPRYAAIDIGTNTVLLSVADYDGSRLRPVLDRAIIARLGQGLDASGALEMDAIGRGLEALGAHLEEARAAGAERVVAVGTAALREAANASRFLSEAKRRFGIDVRVIPGEEEARRAFLAVARDREEPGGGVAGTLVVMDIGGGSTEFISGRARSVQALRSLPVGSVRLTERFLAGDPVRPEGVEALRGRVREALAELPAQGGAGFTVVGVAGTNTTLAAMKAKLARYDAEAIRRTRVSRDDLDDLIRSLAALTLSERRQLPGLEPGRADVILAGAIIAREGLARLGAGTMDVSDRGVRHGVMYGMAERGE